MGNLVIFFPEHHAMETVVHDILVPADKGKLHELRESLSQICDAQGVPPKTARRMILAIDEALTNIIEHAGLHETDTRIDMTMELGDNRIVAEIIDRGMPFDPSVESREPNRKGYPRRGFGLYLIHLIVDSIEYERRPTGENVLTMTKNFD
jgi:anti-sigma regulatory factor (Ser/Thr protein kinase)